MSVNFTQVLPCACTLVAKFRVKGKSRNAEGGQFVTGIPFTVATAGAEFQNKRYGKGLRLHNSRIKEGRLCGMTCTVCGTMKAA
jgi:hypothetical protein